MPLEIWPRGATGGCAWRCSRSTRWPTRRAPGSASHSTIPTRGLASIAPVAGRCWSGRVDGARRPAPVEGPTQGPHPTHGQTRFSRYACVQRPGIAVRWHKMPARHRGTDLAPSTPELLLLPWPLGCRRRTSGPVEGTVQSCRRTPSASSSSRRGRVSTSTSWTACSCGARRGRSVDVVCLPESAVEEGEIDELEALLYRHGVVYSSGGGAPAARPSRAGRRELAAHGVQPAISEGRSLPAEPSPPWFHIRQENTTAGRSTRPDLPVPPRRGPPPSYPLVGVDRGSPPCDPVRRGAELTFVCARLRGPRSERRCGGAHPLGRPDVRPRPLLLDGPQLTSRWAARYASVLADDPGSAVMTLTSYGMVQRSRPPRTRRLPGHRALEGPLQRDPRDSTRNRCARSPSNGLHGLAQPGVAPTAACPSTTGPTASTWRSTRSGPRRGLGSARTASRTGVHGARLEADDLTVLPAGPRPSPRRWPLAPSAPRPCWPTRARTRPGGPR